MNKEALAKHTTKELKRIFRDKSLKPEDRGKIGEGLILNLVEFWAKHYEGSKVLDTYIFPQGPILTSKGGEHEPVTECDVLVITPYKVICIEVKTIYGKMLVDEDCVIYQDKKGDFKEPLGKNYIRQNEMHCRHIYHHLHEFLPDGNPDYIKSVIIMTGNMTFEDNRSDEDYMKHPIVTSNELIPTLEEVNAPDGFLLDVDAIYRKLNKIKVSDSKRLLASQKHIKDKEEKETEAKEEVQK